MLIQNFLRNKVPTKYKHESLLDSSSTSIVHYSTLTSLSLVILYYTLCLHLYIYAGSRSKKCLIFVADFNQLLTLNPTKFSTIGNVVHHPQVNANIQSCELTFVVKPSGPHLQKMKRAVQWIRWKFTMKCVRDISRLCFAYTHPIFKRISFLRF